MKDTRDSHAHFRVRDYSLAVQSAVSWLGDRYLLAEPVRRRKEEFTEYYLEPQRWHDAARRTEGNRA